MVILANVALRQESHRQSRFAHSRRANYSYFDLGKRRLFASNSPNSRARTHLAVSQKKLNGAEKFVSLRSEAAAAHQPSLKPESQSSTSATTSLPRSSFFLLSTAMCSSTTRWHSSRSATSVASDTVGRERPDHLRCISSLNVKNLKPMPELVSLGRNSVGQAPPPMLERLRARTEAARHSIGTVENFGRTRILHKKFLGLIES